MKTLRGCAHAVVAVPKCLNASSAQSKGSCQTGKQSLIVTNA
jgi:hypothetical protein